MADAKSTSLLTPEQQIRLESLLLTYRHDRNPEDVIERASKLAAWVEGDKKAAGRRVTPSRLANGEQVGPENDLI